jgi:hypothetical protein
MSLCRFQLGQYIHKQASVKKHADVDAVRREQMQGRVVAPR